MSDAVQLARAHLERFTQLQAGRADDSRGVSWDVAIETATLLGAAVRELADVRAHVRRLEAAMAAATSDTPAGRPGGGRRGERLAQLPATDSGSQDQPLTLRADAGDRLAFALWRELVPHLADAVAVVRWEHLPLERRTAWCQRAGRLLAIVVDP